MKKVISVLTAAVLLTAVSPIEVKADNPGTLMKDVNFDGQINGVDASMVLAEYARTSAGNEQTFTRTQRYIADVDYDGQVTAVDASFILSTYALKSIGKDVPIKTVLFGIVCNGQEQTYKALTIEQAQQYIDSIKDGYPEGALSITADITVYNGDDTVKVVYAVKE